MQHRVIFITGVSGSGKTSVGKALSAKLQLPFYDGDDFHSDANKAKMGAGVPLTDDDRLPWLRSINEFIREHLKKGSLVVACSALKEKYRAILSGDIAPGAVQWFHLQGSYDLIHERMTARQGHYMGAGMLRSQFDAYEEPATGSVIQIEATLEQLIEKIISMLSTPSSAIGLIGMGVMGASLARNIAGKGFSLSVYNRYVKGKEEGVAAMMASRHEELRQALPFEDIAAFVASLERPRKIILMVNAGKAVDSVISELLPLLEQGDVVMDGGNSHYEDTVRRQHLLQASGVHFVGAGISGGEEGALLGPSIMPGGSMQGYMVLKDVLDAIAAKNDDGEVCCGYIGDGGAGHFVKMVHNGIEYAEMALIAETYTHLRYDQGLSPDEIASVFDGWNDGPLSSYLLEITADILRFRDEDGELLLDKISDQAGSKGTGGWTSIAAAELGVPVPAIAEALFARFISSLGETRALYHSLYDVADGGKRIPLDELALVYQFCRLMNHHQGMALISTASKEFNWQIDASALLRIWSGGCIIRSQLLSLLRHGWDDAHADILQHTYTLGLIRDAYPKIVSAMSVLILSERAFPVISACFQYFKGMSGERSNAYLIQAQRDYFGAHTYRRIDDPTGAAHHTRWSLGIGH